MKRGLAAGRDHSVTPLKKMVGAVGQKENLAYGAHRSKITFSIEQLVLLVIASIFVGVGVGMIMGPGFIEPVQEQLRSVLGKASWGERPAESVLAWRAGSNEL
jgi:hypothetical protein